MRVETAPRMPPTSRAPLHATPCRTCVSWEAQRVKSFTALKTAPPARAPFWAWPNNVSRLYVAQARGLMSVYKRRGAPLYPFTCARAVGAAPTATPSRAGEVNRGKTKAQDGQSNAKIKTAKKQRGEAGSPGKILAGGSLSGPDKTLAGTARPTPTERATLEPTAPSTIISMGPGLGKAPLWWHTDLCEDTFKIRLEDDDCRQDPCQARPPDPWQDPCRGRQHAMARPLLSHPARPSPKTPPRPPPSPCQPSSHCHSHAAASPTSWAGTCVATCSSQANSSSACVAACRSS